MKTIFLISLLLFSFLQHTFAAPRPCGEKELQSLLHAKKNSQLLLPEDSMRPISLQNLAKLEQILLDANKKNLPVQIFMRHGEQSFIPNALREVTENARRLKILMMQSPHNQQDPLTFRSAAELLPMKRAVLALLNKTHQTLRLYTSENRRALQTAKILAYPAGAQIHQTLRCLNYRSDLTEEEILHYIPEGTMRWQREVVKGVVSASAFEDLTRGMQELLDTHQTGPQFVDIFVTHTQQLQIIAALHSGEQIGRLENYGFILLVGAKKNRQMFLFPQGLFNEKNSSPQSTLR